MTWTFKGPEGGKQEQTGGLYGCFTCGGKCCFGLEHRRRSLVLEDRNSYPPGRGGGGAGLSTRQDRNPGWITALQGLRTPGLDVSSHTQILWIISL